ncbi:hypothetical protein ACFLZN_02820 [Nanoarchaeota archaeon]
MKYIPAKDRPNPIIAEKLSEAMKSGKRCSLSRKPEEKRVLRMFDVSIPLDSVIRRATEIGQKSVVDACKFALKTCEECHGRPPLVKIILERDLPSFYINPPKISREEAEQNCYADLLTNGFRRAVDNCARCVEENGRLDFETRGELQDCIRYSQKLRRQDIADVLLTSLARYLQK